MGVFKEEAHMFEQTAKLQKRIFNDACDYGRPYNTADLPTDVVDLIEAVKHFQELDKRYPDEKHMVRSREEWANGVKVTIRIGWEIDEGFECGTQYVISFNYLGMRYEKQPTYLCPGCNAFISVDISPYRELHKPDESEEVWTDPAGGTHHGDEDDPAKMYE